MVLADKLAVFRLDRVIVRIMGHAKHRVGVGLIGTHILFANTGKVGLGKTEDRRHVPEILQFVLMDFAIGLGDMEQAVQQLFENGRVAGEHARDLPGIGFVSGGGFAGLIEHPGNVLGFLGGHLEDPAEGTDFIGRHHAIGLGEFRAQRDDRNGKADLPGRIRLDGLRCVLTRLVHEMACACADQRAQRSADHEPGRAANYLAPDTHGQTFTGKRAGMERVRLIRDRHL